MRINSKRNKALQQVKETKKVRFSERFSHLLKTIIATQGGYLADKLFLFESDNNQGFTFEVVKSNEPPQLRWLILSREHYFETSKIYPIANKRELKQAIHFDDEKGPFDGLTLHHIERIDEQNHRVTFWVVEPNILEKYRLTPWLILPESFILAHALKDGVELASIERINKKLFISKTGLGVFSGVQSSQIQDLESFAFSTGSPLHEDGGNYFTRHEFIGFLAKGLSSLNVSKLQGFFTLNANKLSLNSFPWKVSAVLSVSVFSVYLSLSSLWLIYKEHQLTNEIKAQQSQVNEALTLQRAFQQELQWQKLLFTPTQNISPHWDTWKILLEAVNVGAQFKNLEFKNKIVTFHGTADESVKATDILAKLSDNPKVQSASFSQPVRKYRGKEDFVISFSFVEKTNGHVSQLKSQQGVD